MNKFLKDLFQRKENYDNEKVKARKNKDSSNKNEEIIKTLESFIREKDTTFNSYYIERNSEKKRTDNIKMVILVKEYFRKFWLNYYIKINSKKETIETYSFLTFKDGGEIIVENNALKVLLSRYFTRINYLLRCGAFYINNSNGQFGLKIVSLMDSSIFQKDEEEKENEKTMETENDKGTYSNLTRYLKNTFQHIKDQFDFHVVKILYLINHFKDGEYRSLEQEHLEGKFYDFPQNISKKSHIFKNSIFTGKLNADHMERCRFLKSSLRKIDKELKTKNEFDKDISSAMKNFYEFKDQMILFDSQNNLGISENINEYYEAFKALDNSEDNFTKKYKELASLCKEERYLDELTETIDNEYKNFKRIYDSLRIKEGSLINLEKASNLDQFYKYFLSILLNENIDPNFKIQEENDADYKQNFQDILKKIDCFNQILALFKFSKSEGKEMPIVSQKISQFSNNTTLNASELMNTSTNTTTVKTINADEVRKTERSVERTVGMIPELPNLGGNLEKSLVDKFLGTKSNENNDIQKKKISTLSEYAGLVRKLKEDLWRYCIADTKLMKKINMFKDKPCKKTILEKILSGKNEIGIVFDVKDRKEDIKKYEDYFKQSKSQQNKNAPSPFIFSQITSIKNQKDKRNLTSGGFADIFKLVADIEFTQGPSQKEKMLIMKIAKKINGQTETSEKQRIENERQILNHLKGKECPFIGKYYWCDEIDYRETLLMEYYSYKSLDQFKLLYWPTISLNTKIFILYQTAQGIKFLKENNIYHLDLKPGNILLHKNFVAKIIDFGESLIYTEKEAYKHKPGRTLPFAPPEIFFEEIKYSDKIDVFSFGVVVADLLYDEYLVDFRRSHLNVLQMKYTKGTYKARLYEETVKTKGPKHLMKFLRILILKCVEYEISNRAAVEWLIIILRDSLGLLEKMY